MRRLERAAPRHPVVEQYLHHMVDFYTGAHALTQAVRHGYWIVLDELNLAPSEVLEALNRLLDDNRELLLQIAQASLRTKMHRELSDLFTEIVVDAVLCRAGSSGCGSQRPHAQSNRYGQRPCHSTRIALTDRAPRPRRDSSGPEPWQNIGFGPPGRQTIAKHRVWGPGAISI